MWPERIFQLNRTKAERNGQMASSGGTKFHFHRRGQEKNRLHTWNSDYSRIDLTNESFQSYKCLFSPYGDNFPHLISITEGLKLQTVYDRFHSFLWSSVFRTEIRLKWMSLLRKGPFDTHKSARKRDYRKIWVQHEYLWYSPGYHISWNAIKKGSPKAW